MVYLHSQCDEHAIKYPNEEPAPDDGNQDACKNHYRGPDRIPGLSGLRCTGLGFQSIVVIDLGNYAVHDRTPEGT